MKITNDTAELERVLGLDKGTARHVGNYQFTAKMRDVDVLVNAEPIDNDEDAINVYSIELKEGDPLGCLTGIQERKLKIKFDDTVAAYNAECEKNGGHEGTAKSHRLHAEMELLAQLLWDLCGLSYRCTYNY